MHRAWIVIGSIVTAVALGFGTLNVVGILAHEEVAERETFDASGITGLDLATGNGSVEIVGADVDQIRLTAEISHGLRPTSHRAEVDGTTLVVRSSCPFLSTWCRVDYRVEVPRDLDVLASIDHGRMDLRDLDGPVDVDGDNGSIELIRLAGPVTARTDNGSVRATGLRGRDVVADSDNGTVSLSFADPPNSVQATTENGSVEVVLPEGEESYRVDVDTSHGGTDVGVRTDPSSDRVVIGRTRNGSVTVRYVTG